MLGKESIGLSLASSFLAFFWLLFGVLFYFLFRNSADFIYSLVVIIACPVIYFLWMCCARSKVPALVKEAEPQIQQKAQAEAAKQEKYRKKVF